MRNLRTVLFVVTFFLCGYATTLADERPNIVFFLADDLGYGDVGFQGGEIPTPNIDSIAKSGIRFTDGYVTAAVCGPSRAGLLTGRYQQSFGYYDNIGPFRLNKDIVPGTPTNIPILPERMKKLGYVCGMFGKNHDGDAEGMLPYSRWDEFYGFNNGASNYLGGMNRAHNPIYHNKKKVSVPLAEQGLKHSDVCQKGIILRNEKDYLTDKLGERAVAFIEKNKERRFLCYVPFNAIHGPFQAPKALVEKYSHIQDEERRIVAAMLDSMDQNVGRVLNALRKNNLIENTLIVFLSDNGGHKQSPCKPLRGTKGTYWEGGIRIPFALAWPAKIKAGQTRNIPVSSLDLLPTFIAAAGGKTQPDWKLDGINLLPYLTDPKKEYPTRTLYWHVVRYKAIRVGNYKVLSFDDGKTFRLYDLAADPSETTDLAAERPEQLRTMLKKYKKWEDQLMPQQWGWKSDLGYKDPNFGK